MPRMMVVPGLFTPPDYADLAVVEIDEPLWSSWPAPFPSTRTATWSATVIWPCRPGRF
jgi:hypothetical protein